MVEEGLDFHLFEDLMHPTFIHQTAIYCLDRVDHPITMTLRQINLAILLIIEESQYAELTSLPQAYSPLQHSKPKFLHKAHLDLFLIIRNEGLYEVYFM